MKRQPPSGFVPPRGEPLFCPANGLVLAGGRSERMGTDKAFLEYHGKAQWQFVYELLAASCPQTYLSIRTPIASFSCISDKYENMGPAAGLLTAFETELKSWLVVGIDYPYFGQEALRQLIQEHDPSHVATVFFKPETGFFEPMLGIYEPEFYNHLKQSGHFSLQQLLRSLPVKKIPPQEPRWLRSVDTWEDYEVVRADLLANDAATISPA